MNKKNLRNVLGWVLTVWFSLSAASALLFGGGSDVKILSALISAAIAFSSYQFIVKKMNSLPKNELCLSRFNLNAKITTSWFLECRKVLSV